MRAIWKSLVVAALVPLAACGGGGSKGEVSPPLPTVPRPVFPDGSSLSHIQARGRLVVGVKFDQPGLGQTNPVTGEVEGFDVEVAKVLAQDIFGGNLVEAATHLELREARTPERETLIESGSVDLVIASYTINDARRQRVDFAGPYLVAGQDVLVRLDDEAVHGPADLNGRRVCSVRGSTSSGNLQRAAPSANVVLTDTYSACVDMLRQSTVDAVTTDNTILAGFVASYPTELKGVGVVFSEEPYGIGLKKGDTALRAFVNDALVEAVATGGWVTAFNATLGHLGLTTPPPPAVNRYAG